MSTWSLLERAFGWGGIVAYHGIGDAPHAAVMHVSPPRLRAQLTYLHERYTVVPLRELVSRWHARLSTRGCVAITFDDAYAGVSVYALPIMRDLEIPATVFVTSRHAAQGGSYWWDDIERERAALRAEWTDEHEALGMPRYDPMDAKGVDRIRRRVICSFAGRWPGPIVQRDDTVWRSMNWDELAALAAEPLVDFGVHTLSHPALPLLSYAEQLAEMRDNLSQLRERLPRVLPIVAYPYGLYDSTTVRAAQEAGMVAGLTMEGRATADHPSPMTVPRVGAGEIHSPPSLGRRLNRALRPFLVIRNRGSHPRVPSDPLARRFDGISAELQTT
ncbi:MAG: hypothetical protein DMD30_10400 [Gemmatimonadetes bacterium]|nr:MAG: hypothetical protein DMD30_10400 [Gemmatimonadota bacterium]